MKEYWFEEISLGLSESFQVEITQEMMDKFREISSDVNPLHNDTEFAKARGYEDRVVYGMLIASQISTLGGVYLPGKYCLIHGVEIDFTRPVYVGDKLTISGTVKEIHESVRRLTIKFVIKNQTGKTVSKGILKAGCME